MKVADGRCDVSRHGPLVEEFQHAGFEDLVADRQHVIAVREYRAPARSASAPPVPAASRRRRPWCRPRPAPASRCARPPRASASGASRGCRRRAPCGRIWSARRKRGTCGPVGSVTSSSDGASSASAMLSGSPTPSTSWMPSPPRISERTRSRMLEREERGDARAHRIAHDVGALDAEMIEQRAHVLRHAVGVIVGRIVELGRLAVAAIVERDHAAAGARQRRDPAGLTQFTSLVEAKPWTSTIGSPSPSSR